MIGKASKSSSRVQDWWHEIINDEKLNWSASDFAIAIERSLDEDVCRDLNKLDSQGTTALHEAVKLENNSVRIAAIEGLLRCGADINVMDSHGKTALMYFSTEINEISAVYLLVRINILAQLDLAICEQNRQWYRKWHENIFSVWRYSCDNNAVVDDIKKYAFYGMIVSESATEMKALRRTKVNNQMTLAQVLNETSEGQLVDHLDDLRKVVKSEEFYGKFIDFGGLIKQRYRKALFTRSVWRKKLKPLAMKAVEILFELPDLCNELVVGYLSFNDIIALLEALQYQYRDYCKVKETICRKHVDDLDDSVLESISSLFS